MADEKPEVAILPGGNPWSSYMPDVYRGRVGPQPLGTVIFEEIEAKAKEKLKDHEGAFMYAGGSAGTNSTYRANLKAFEKWGIIPRMLVDATRRSLEVTIFGVTHSSPIFLAPIGVQSTFHPDGEFNPARAGKALGVPFISSTASSRSLEEVAEANGDGYRWYQLYWPKSHDVALSLLKRAKDNNFKALVITLDTMSIGWRPHDLAISYIPFAHGVGVQIGKSDPVFMAKHGKEVTHEHPVFPYDPAKIDKAFAAGDPKAREDVYLGSEWLKEANSGLYHSWEDLKFIRDNWEGPLLLKGIQSVHDAEKALEHGVNGIIVSNHGGRQLDGAIPSLLALEVIMKSQKVRAAQQAGELTVLFDSGIRTGSDIIKAMALGAQAVLLGRPWLYGSILAGQAGVEQVIRHTLADLDTSLGLAGYRNLAEIQGKGEEVIMKIT
ncbi:putative lactate 2-monooxygenase PB1A11.03 [Psilocybe cubensis]|uniref:FMN hydroxy acid dehydrogenase domain-containing protein n=2 Tax=Psilocybe cubensis TaxID=181762 RepID=A0A8H7Y0T6_PSICU|nr:putative lactate 2-monooxygenase PB1A11.03 [Psilocybe cubensis]KAH9480377.1 putative lactate 2-monooxygenase PB1A11.03 [Psilocybe cubensis]